MYQHQPTHGEGGIEPGKAPYRRRGIETKSKQDIYSYLDRHSGEYDDTERKILIDPYADGWDWRETGKPLSAWKPQKWLSKAAKAEQNRLFTMGFNDASR